MKILLLGFLMAQSMPGLDYDPIDDDNMIPAIHSWCEDNKVIYPTQDGKGKVGVDCTAEGMKCRTESMFNKYVDKYTIFAFCDDKVSE